MQLNATYIDDFLSDAHNSKPHYVRLSVMSLLYWHFLSGLCITALPNCLRVILLGIWPDLWKNSITRKHTYHYGILDQYNKVLGATKYLYKRVCQSVGPSVRRSIRRSVRLSVRWSVRNPFFTNPRKRLFLAAEMDGIEEGGDLCNIWYFAHLLSG